MRTPQNQHYQNTNNTRTTHTHTTRTTHTHTHTQHAPQSTTQLYTHTTRKPPLAPKHPNSYRHTHVSIHFFVPPTTSPTSNERRHLPAPSPTSRDSFDTFDTSLILDARFASCVCVCVSCLRVVVGWVTVSLSHPRRGVCIVPGVDGFHTERTLH